MKTKMPVSFDSRFWPKVDLLGTNGCWLWTAGKTHDGYGFLGAGARGAPQVYVHRYTYESLVGPIPAGLQLDHLCRVRHCCNPAHLEPVTNRENHQRTPKARATHCLRGHEFTPENTGRHGRRGTRTCLACKRLRRQATKACTPLLAAGGDVTVQLQEA